MYVKNPAFFRIKAFIKIKQEQNVETCMKNHLDLWPTPTVIF